MFKSQWAERSFFNSSLVTYIIIPGFNDVTNNAWTLEIKNHLFTLGDCNLIIVDWSQCSMHLGSTAMPLKNNPAYIKTVKNVEHLCNAVAWFLFTADIKKPLTHCIGHGFGVYAC